MDTARDFYQKAQFFHLPLFVCLVIAFTSNPNELGNDFILKILGFKDLFSGDFMSALSILSTSSPYFLRFSNLSTDFISASLTYPKNRNS